MSSVDIMKLQWLIQAAVETKPTNRPGVKMSWSKFALKKYDTITNCKL